MRDILFDVVTQRNLYNVIITQIRKVLKSNNVYEEYRILDRLFSYHGEDWDFSSLEECIAGVYAKSGAKTPQEFQDYIELQVTFNV